MTCCAALASLLAWRETRSCLALVLVLLLSVVSLALIVTGLIIREGDSAAPAAEFIPEDEAVELIVVPPASTPVVSGSGVFRIEAASDPDLFVRPTAFTFDDEGGLFVGHELGIGRLSDLDSDGYYEDLQHFGYDGGWVFGLALYEGSLYAAIDGSLLRFTDTDGDGATDEQATLLTGLPRQHFGGHSNSGILIDDGLIYMTVGGTSDHGPELEPFGGTILTMPVEGGEPRIHARGFRNPYDIAFCPDGRLYASDNGPDFIAADSLETAPDEVNLIVEGGDYGYPDYFGPQPAETGTESPVALLPIRAGATGIVCHDGAGLPPEFSGNLFVTMWGTFDIEREETGRRVMRVELSEAADGTISGVTAEFAANFGNPIDVLQEADGSLLVLDFSRGQLFRIRYAP